METLRNIFKLPVSSATRLSSEQICRNILAYASRAADMVTQGDMPAFTEMLRAMLGLSMQSVKPKSPLNEMGN